MKKTRPKAPSMKAILIFLSVFLCLSSAANAQAYFKLIGGKNKIWTMQKDRSGKDVFKSNVYSLSIGGDVGPVGAEIEIANFGSVKYNDFNRTMPAAAFVKAHFNFFGLGYAGGGAGYTLVKDEFSGKNETSMVFTTIFYTGMYYPITYGVDWDVGGRYVSIKNSDLKYNSPFKDSFFAATTGITVHF